MIYIRLFFVTILCVFVLTQCKKTSNITHQYLRVSNAITITKMTYNGQIYFVYGRFSADTIPKEYIKPIEGMDNAYLCYIVCKSDTCTLLSPYGGWEVKGNSQKFLFRKINNYEHNSMSADTSYIYSYGDIFPNN